MSRRLARANGTHIRKRSQRKYPKQYNESLVDQMVDECLYVARYAVAMQSLPNGILCIVRRFDHTLGNIEEAARAYVLF